MFKFENLKVYQKALVFADIVYRITNSWPKQEIYGLTNQFRRAAISIALNIAEGSSRTNKDFSHFLSLARGSCFECVAILMIAKNQKLITNNQYLDIYGKCLEMSKMLSSLRTKINGN
ncbi:hypothetical protein A2954_05000 [Candidatus Roizmanbacteria bacterium RIFCSPLOWO2_01_FULL_37_12]|uniref:Four helix bundle protein n=1 Tax=Candidatus Roizmanbacteria bacterium RIFCSPLOWO2_01_FULL_37_12 TaxID=1802056 RepID=A0A1F7I8S0_9BACT|nr:MAG: hypothetical protein A2768_02095 [Candidatus Roizmanbacteria bacterium RIFCSPHIGHO2_01_FULL_37_16]OGK23715.1 MAG: hypothetical protein A3D76_04045 [Candidatus Roizmanbacteria bacterium RIFCSPHIGHO2_02_FULL_37_9b]OGK39753.1 MAG: hypothetical protein A2954_05000 [Candidatus Roizmanbacteria bacterium RIFCSPLOWO2_01_FULL_37_12]